MKLTNQTIHALWQKHFTDDDIRILPAVSGINSQTARVTAKKRKYFVKAYVQFPGDARDRMTNEVRALRFLREQGVEGIPQPVLADEELRLAVFDCIEGEHPRPSDITREDVSESILGLWGFQRARDAASGAGIPPASEACFSVNEYLACVKNRIGMLLETPDESVNAWTTDTLFPFWEELYAGIRAALTREAVDPERTLTPEERVLSPSDVGFHNILRGGGRNLYFVDFEYFGWDDPVKMVCDFILEPAVPLPPALKPVCVREFFTRFSLDDSARSRFRICYPLLSLKWCLIILNAFLPGRFNAGQKDEGVLERQRALAAVRLEALRREWNAGAYESWV